MTRLSRLERSGFQSSPNDPPLPWIENPNKTQMPYFDRQVFGKTKYRSLSFPTRFHSRVEEPDRYFSPPDPNKDRPDPEFLFFEGPLNRRGRGSLPTPNGESEWEKVDRMACPREFSPSVRICAGEPSPIDRVVIAMALGPAPSRWDEGAVAHLKILDGEKVVSETAIEPGRNISFWREPYLPAANLVWKETRGFFAPVGIFAVSTDCPPVF